MEHKELREKVLKEAQRLGDWLLEIGKKDDTGIIWETMGMDEDRNITFSEGEGIYSGTSGISLFLMELYKVTGEERFKEACMEGLRRIVHLCKENTSEYYAMFTGRMGVPYTLLKTAEWTGDGNWIDLALEFAGPVIDGSAPIGGVDDLINGSAGTLMALMHLHAATGKGEVLKAAERYAEHLIKAAHQGPRGLYWDRSPKAISGLCGFSHGAAGVGWVFLELGRYLDNPTFFRVAKDAFLYESLHYSNQIKNWQDLRNGIYSDEDEVDHRNAYLENNMEFFTKGKDMNAWCHGGAGIGLARLRGMEIFKAAGDDEAYRHCEADFQLAYAKTKVTDADNETLERGFSQCHGGGGNADLFITAYNVLKDQTYLDDAWKVAGRALESNKKMGRYISGYHSPQAKGEDSSLFMGNAGVGYFFLRLLEPLKVPSMLCPTLNADALPATTFASGSTARFSASRQDRILLEKAFARTLVMTEHFLPEQLEGFFEKIGAGLPGETSLNYTFIGFIEESLPALPPKERECLNDIFVVERERVNLDGEVAGHSYLAAKSLVLKETAEKLNELDEAEFIKLSLILESDVRIATTDWDWNYRGESSQWLQNVNLEPDIYPLLVKVTPLGMMEEPLSAMTYTILDSFSEGGTVAGAIGETIEAFEALNPEQVEMLKGKIVEQIRNALLGGILIEKKD